MSPITLSLLWKRSTFLAILFLTIGMVIAFAPGASVVQAEATSQPPNDDIANAHEIPSLPFSAWSDMAYATLEEGEIFPSCFLYSGYENSARTVWYRFTPPEVLQLAMGG